MHLDGRAVGGVVLRPRRQAGPAVAVQVRYHFCFGVGEFANAYTHLWPQVPTNKKVGVMWPNDADGNAIRASLGPAAREGRLHDRRPGRLQGRDERLLGADREVQGRGLPDLQHVPDPAGLRDVLAAGGPAGLHSRQDRADRQDRAVPLAGRGARRDRRRTWRAPATGTRPGRTPRRSPASPRSSSADGYDAQSRQAVEPAARPEPRAVRRRRRRAQGERQPEGQGRGRQRDEDAARSTTPIGALDWRQGARRAVNVVPTPIIGGQWRKGDEQVQARLRRSARTPTTRTSRLAAKLKPYTT